MKRNVITVGIAVWIVLGMVGALVPSVRQLSWAIGVVGGVTGWLLIAMTYARQGRDEVAVGFSLMALGEVVALSGLGGTPAVQQSALVGSWTLFAPALLLISPSGAYPAWVRAAGVIAGVVFAVMAVQNFVGYPVTPDSPLAFVAYPVAMIAAIGWIIGAWQQDAAPGQTPAPAPSGG